MKFWLKKAFVLILACICVISMVACGEKKTEIGKTEEAKTEKAETKVDFDFSGYPKELNAWGIEDMQKYLEATGVFVEPDWEISLSSGDLGPMNVTSGILYMERTTMSINDMVLYFDPNGAEAIQTQKENAKTKHALEIEGGQPVTVDRVVGNFGFQYEQTTDEKHKTALIKAMDDLKTYYGENK